MSADLSFDVVELTACQPPAETLPALRELAFRSNAWSAVEIEQLRGMFAADAPFAAIGRALKRGRLTRRGSLVSGGTPSDRGTSLKIRSCASATGSTRPQISLVGSDDPARRSMCEPSSWR